MSKYVYSFGGRGTDGNGEMKDTLGGKGAGLAEMSLAGVPVPPGFTIATQVCNLYFDAGNKTPANVENQMDRALVALEKKMGKKLGNVRDPLLVSVRSGAKFSMPGMMDTVLNLGLNDKTVKGLVQNSGNPRFSYDCYRRFIQMFGAVVMELEKDDFEHIFESIKNKKKAKLDSDLTAEDLEQVVIEFKKFVKKKTGVLFPQDPHAQLRGARDAVFRSWHNQRAIFYRRMNGIPDDLGTAVNVQAMVFGNLGDTSATGVGFTRNPATGHKEFYGEFLINAQGEDVVAGIRTPRPIKELEGILPQAYKQLHRITKNLEKHYRDTQDFEFTIQDSKLFMLQTRNGKRTGPAAVKIAVDMVQERLISREEAVMRVEPQHLDQLLHPVLAPNARKSLTSLVKGLPASPGAAVGKVVFSADDAVKQAPKGPVVLVRGETTPDDIHGMEVAKGILTSRGGMTSHAAVVARGMGTPCVAGAGDLVVSPTKKRMNVGKLTLREGDWISLDGSSGEVFAGQANTIEPDTSSGHLERFMKWVDQFRSMSVRANAEVPRDAKMARRFGAEGIGLCRTEHMFFEGERLEHMRTMILADSETNRRKALRKLLPMQRRDFASLFKVMNGYPVVIRTLDPPLHEFLPKREDLMVEIAELKALNKKKLRVRKLEKLLGRVEELHEFNPMLGHRGCRLGITFPEITEMQAQAIFEAAVQCSKKGIKVIPEIMIPLVGNVKELENQKKIVVETAEKVFMAKDKKVKYMVGTMIEVPRGALTADQIAEQAEFFSFGTNDLTQTTFGFSRDDAGGFIEQYKDRRIFEEDPFAVLDVNGVGQLIEIAVEKGRKTRAGLEVGICGEHGGDPKSVEFCVRAGLDYVSASPYRVPIAKLAAAQAALSRGREETMRTA